MKNKLLSILALSLSSCVTFNPGGEIDLSYVPRRIDDRLVENQLKLGLEAYVDADFDNAKLRVGGKATTYANFPLPEDKIVGGFEPTRISYDIYSKLYLGDLTFYAFHNCTHPVNEQEFFLHDEEGKGYTINHDSITELGIKLKF